MADALAANVLAYCLQVCALVAAAALVTRVCRIASPRVRLALWRTVLAVCLTLPLLQPWRSVPPAPSSGPAAASGADGPGDATASRRAPSVLQADFVEVAGEASGAAGTWTLALVGAGAAGRFAWLAVGFMTLRRLRRGSTPADGSVPALGAAFDLTGTVADIRISPAVAEAVTFGVRRPVVLVPARFLEFSHAEQVAVLCHELLHVRRLDWTRTLADEIVRTCLWFHPGIWWLLDQIHLCREQLVDRLVVALTGDRQPYLSALWRLMSQRPGLALRPASAFLGRAHVIERVALLVKEVPMSRLRLASSLVVIALFVAGAAVVGVHAFPLSDDASAVLSAETALRLAARAEQQPPAVRAIQPAPATRPGAVPPRPPMRAGAPARKRNVDPLYPATAPGFDRAALVALQITVDAAGKVSEVKATAGDEPFVTAAIDAARQWEFERPSRAPVHLRYHVMFPKPSDLPAPIASRFIGTITPEDRARAAEVAATMRRAEELTRARAGATSDGNPVTFNFKNATVRDAITLLARSAGVEIRDGGMPLDVAVTVAVKDTPFDTALRTLLEQAGLDYRKVGPGVYELTKFNAAAPIGALRIGGNLKPPLKTYDVPPIYPDAAREARVQGIVIIEATVGADGKVMDARILRSIPLLDEAALEAVRQWEYTPTLLNGAPVPVIMTVTVNFTLQ